MRHGDHYKRWESEEFAILLVSEDGEITPEQIEAWADHNLYDWLELQGFEWTGSSWRQTGEA